MDKREIRCYQAELLMPIKTLRNCYCLQRTSKHHQNKCSCWIVFLPLGLQDHDRVGIFWQRGLHLRSAEAKNRIKAVTWREFKAENTDFQVSKQEASIKITLNSDWNWWKRGISSFHAVLSTPCCSSKDIATEGCVNNELSVLIWTTLALVI